MTPELLKPIRVNLPNLPITIVHRSDGWHYSVFTSHLSRQSGMEAKSGLVKNSRLAIRCANEGVTAQVSTDPGGIGVEYGYAAE